MSKNKTWLAAYLYYNEPWETLLVNAVEPFVRAILKEGLADQYFFIRYWERGPHVRLRFYGDTQTLNEQVKPRLLEHFNQYLKENPSERQEPNYPEGYDEKYIWYPNNTVQFIEYEPETERYGGAVGLPISERHFEDASDATFALIQDAEEFSYERALGAAIQLHLGFAHGTGMSLKEAQHFYNRFSKSWLPRAYMHWGEQLTEEQRKEREAMILKAFKETFDNQKEMLVNFHQMIWDALSEGVEFDVPALNKWVADVQRTTKELQEAQKADTLTYPNYGSYNSINETIDVAPDRQKLWWIYESYIHMINNRLGIQNREEGFLGYLLVQCLNSIE